MWRPEETIMAPNHFTKKAKHYFVLYKAPTAIEKSMKGNLLSLSNSEIHCWVIIEAGSADERRQLFGILFTRSLFMACEVVSSLTCYFHFKMLSKGRIPPFLVMCLCKTLELIWFHWHLESKNNHDHPVMAGAKKYWGKDVAREIHAKQMKTV